MSNIIEHLNGETAVTLNALMKATGLTQTGLTLALVGLGGQVTVRDGGIVLAPPPAPAAPLLVGQVGRRPKAEREAEIAACRELILDTIRNAGSAAAPILHKACGFAVDYRNIHRAAVELLEEELIAEEKVGRMRVWVRGPELDNEDRRILAENEEFETLG